MLNYVIIMLICSLLICATQLGVVEAHDIGEKMLVRVNWQEPAEIHQLRSWNLDFASRGAICPGEYVDIFLRPEELEQIENGGYSYTILNDSLRDIRIDEQYLSYEEMMDTINVYEALYPDILKVYDIGDSWESAHGDSNQNYTARDIWAVKLSDNVEQEEDEPAILICGLHHAREPLSVNMVVEVMKQLADNYEVDPEIQRYVDSLEIWLVPIVNPDGHHLVTSNYDVWWRKNSHDNNNNGYIDDHDGVDPNRNYSYKWELANSNPNGNTYRGERPFSEPEIQAIRDLCLTQRPVIVNSYHTYGEWVLYPYAWSNDISPPDLEPLGEIAEAMAETNGYRAANDEFSTAKGEMCDWTYTQLGAMSYTTEMATQFIPPGSQIQEIIELNLPANFYLMDRVLRSKIELHVVDAITNVPVVATIEVLEIPLPDDFAPRQSDPLFGRHDRLLVPGDYTLSVNADCYHRTTFSVTVTEDAATILNVMLNNVCDLDHDGQIDVEDLRLATDCWYSGGLSADVNNDLIVDIRDIQIIISKINE